MTKEEIIKSELNTNELTPVQWSKILLVMDKYAKLLINCNNMLEDGRCNLFNAGESLCLDILKTKCKHREQIKNNYC